MSAEHSHIVVVGAPPEIADSIRHEAERQRAAGHITREIVVTEAASAPFVLIEPLSVTSREREWTAVLRLARCTTGHRINVYDATGTDVTDKGIPCPVCCPSAYTAKPVPEPPSRKRVTIQNTPGLYGLLYAWADKHKDDDGEVGNKACEVLCRLDNLLERYD